MRSVHSRTVHNTQTEDVRSHKDSLKSTQTGFIESRSPLRKLKTCLITCYWQPRAVSLTYTHELFFSWRCLLFDQYSSVLVILPLHIPCEDWPSARWMIYGDRSGPQAQSDVIQLKRGSALVGTLLFHPSEGGLLFAPCLNSRQIISDRSVLRSHGEPIAVVKMMEHESFALVLANGIEVCGSSKQPALNHSETRTWKRTLMLLQDALYE